MRLTHVRVLTTEFRKTFVWYRDMLGLPTSFSESDGPYAEFKLGDDRYLGLFSRMLMAAAIGRDDESPLVEAMNRVALVFEVPDVDLEHARLKGLGVEVASPPTDRPAWGLRTVHVRDPEGNLIELYQGIPDGAAT